MNFSQLEIISTRLFWNSTVLCIAIIFLAFGLFKRKCYAQNASKLPHPFSFLGKKVSTGVPLDEECTGETSLFFSLKKLQIILVLVIWPIKNIHLKLYILFSFLSVIAGCILNFYVPIYSRMIAERLTVSTRNHNNVTTEILKPKSDPAFEIPAHPDFEWSLIIIYIVLKLFQGEGSLSLLHCIQNILWIPIEQHVSLGVQLKFFEHLHCLSLSWHTEAKTGEILGALERGNESLIGILENMFFSFIPVIVDIFIAIFYLSTIFNWWFGCILFVQVVVYLLTTIWVSEQKSKRICQLSMNDADNAQRQRAVESMLHFETVKSFSNEVYESAKYKKAILSFQKQQKQVQFYIHVLKMIQVFIVNIGLLTCSIFCVWMIVYDRKLGVGDYVLLSAYLAQLYGPMNYLGTYYRILHYKLIGLEQLYDIFQTKPAIMDKPGALDLEVKHGHLEFKNVSYRYNSNKKILNNVSFLIPAGKTFALVGSSGSGKTSIVRLIIRFYEVYSGEILIDGVNIQDMSQNSLRNAIGVVPQEAAVFADSFKNNIKYGKLDACFSEIKDAAKSACIDTKISSLPYGYETLIGERGLNMSGGERQRISISRIVLKNPKILLFDEATSALDSCTESKIHNTFRKLCLNKTALIVTHRLSSIIDVDQIMVLKNGKIVETGSHKDLLDKAGEYSRMYFKQNVSRQKTKK